MREMMLFTQITNRTSANWSSQLEAGKGWGDEVAQASKRLIHDIIEHVWALGFNGRAKGSNSAKTRK